MTPARLAVLPGTLVNVSVRKALRNHPNRLLARYNIGLFGHPALWIASTTLNAGAWEGALPTRVRRSIQNWL